MPFHFCHSVFWKAYVFNLDEVQLIFILVCTFVSHLKTVKTQVTKIVLLELLQVYLLQLDLWSTKSWFFYMVWGKGSFLCTGHPIVPVSYIEKTILPLTELLCNLCQKSTDYIHMCLFLNSSFCSIWSIMFSFTPIHYSIDYCSFITNIEIR